MHGYNLFWQNSKINLIFKNPSLVFFNQPCHLAAKTQLCFQGSLRRWQKHRIIVNTDLHKDLVHYSGSMCKPGGPFTAPSAPHFPTLCCSFLRGCECPSNREILSSGAKTKLSGSAEGGRYSVSYRSGMQMLFLNHELEYLGNLNSTIPVNAGFRQGHSLTWSPSYTCVMNCWQQLDWAGGQREGHLFTLCFWEI